MCRSINVHHNLKKSLTGKKMEKEVNFGKVSTPNGLGKIITAICSENSSQKIVKELFERLSYNEKKIAFGIFFENKNLKKVAEECDLTFEKTRQIKEKTKLLFRNELRNVLSEFEAYAKQKKEIRLNEETEVFFPDLSVRARNVLRELKLLTVIDITNQKLSDLRKKLLWTQKTEVEITEFLQENGLSFQNE